MSTQTLEVPAPDRVAAAIARAVSIANEAAVKEGVDSRTFFIRVDEKGTPAERVWQVHYIPRDYLQSRGGDVMVLVDECSGEVTQILLGQ